MHDNTIVQTLWISEYLGEHQRFCLQSFLDQGHAVHLYSYGHVDNVPAGVQRMDAGAILDYSTVFKDLYQSYATFSDWFRIKLLYDVGGWWVDSDMLCIQPFIIDWPYVFATEIEKLKDGETTHICNCVIKMPKGNAMAASILVRIEEALASRKPTEIRWTEIGAQYMAKEIIAKDLFDYVVAAEVFCPFDYSSFKRVFTEGNTILSEMTYGVHLWNKMWEWSKTEPMVAMSANSFFSNYAKM